MQWELLLTATVVHVLMSEVVLITFCNIDSFYNHQYFARLAPRRNLLSLNPRPMVVMEMEVEVNLFLSWKQFVLVF